MNKGKKGDVSTATDVTKAELGSSAAMTVSNTTQPERSDRCDHKNATLLAGEFNK
jgi:hypothetical protein